MPQPRAVMDTNVLYAAFRSRLGASFELFQRLRQDEWRAVVSNHLVHEYEEVLKRSAGALESQKERLSRNASNIRGGGVSKSL